MSFRFLFRFFSRSLFFRFTINRERNQSFILAGALKPVREGKLFDFFIVVGYKGDNPDSTGNPPEILFQFPNMKLPNAQLCYFCFPEGVSTVPIEDEQHFEEILIGGPKLLEEKSAPHLFLLTGSDVLLHGICLTKPEILGVRIPFASTPPSSITTTTTTTHSLSIDNA